MFPIIIPKPIGTSRSGSQSFKIATEMNAIPMAIMMICCHVMLANPVYCRNCCRLSITVFIDYVYANVTIASPSWIESPFATHTAATVPSDSACISFSIFMASRIATT